MEGKNQTVPVLN